MRKSKILAAILAVFMELSPPVAFAGCAVVVPAGKQFGAQPTGWLWAIFGCSSGIILAAMVANFQQNRQLTAQEAWTCGLLFWFNPPKPH